MGHIDMDLCDVHMLAPHTYDRNNQTAQNKTKNKKKIDIKIYIAH